MRKDIRIVLVGDEGVGKSSIITALVRDCFIEKVQPLIPEVTIPQEVTTEKITTHIVDTSGRPEDRAHLEDEIKRSSVICAVYDVTDSSSLQRLSSYWLPFIRQLGVNVPVIIVANKLDSSETGAEHRTQDRTVEELMVEFKEVVCGCDCSAKSIMNIATLFFLAQRMVIYPIGPLYDCQEHIMKPKCIEAFRRIFKLCDKDRDGVLNDTEINYFQKSCFGHNLDATSLDALKDITRQLLPSGLSTTANFFNEDGFLFLQKLCIQRGKQESPWIALRRFGYGEDLSLRREFICPFLEVPADSSCELSPKGYQFFTELFRLCDKDKDGALSPHELDDLFSTSPGNHPWKETDFPNSTLTNTNGYVTLQGFLAQWSMTTLLEYKTTLKYLAYLGFEGDTKTAIQITHSRRIDRQKNRVIRHVFLCYIFGAVGSGKTSLLRSFVRKPLDSETNMCHAVVNAVEMRGSEKYLVLIEGTPSDEQDFLNHSKKAIACDLVCFFYDSNDANSFSYVTRLRDSGRFDTVPCIFVATKCDLDAVSQRSDFQPLEYCKKMRIPAPICISTRRDQTSNLFHMLISTALDPKRALPSKHDSKRTNTNRVIAISSSLAFLSLGIYAYCRLSRPSSVKPIL